MNSLLNKIPTLPQRQDSLAEQLADLRMVANRLGMHDAADFISQLPAVEKVQLKYGCHCDLEPQMAPDGCVIDTGEIKNCVYAKPDMRKEQCEYWKPISIT